jgi:hypothetical protein
MRAGRRDTESAVGRVIGQHPVRGHYANFSYDFPKGQRRGYPPIARIFGRNYGRLWVKPYLRGNPKYGMKKKQRAELRVGDLTDPNTGEMKVVTPTVLPAPLPEKKESQPITHDEAIKKTGTEGN